MTRFRLHSRDSLAHSRPINSLLFSHDGSQLLSGSDDGTIKIWTTARWKLVQSINSYQGGVVILRWVPDQLPLCSYFISGGSDGTVKLWRLAAGQYVEASAVSTVSPPTPPTAIEDMVVTNTRLVVTNGTGVIFFMINVQDDALDFASEEAWVPVQGEKARSVVFLDGQMLLISFFDSRQVEIWSLAQSQPLQLHCHRLNTDIGNMTWSAATNRLLVWNMHDGVDIYKLSLLKRRPILESTFEIEMGQLIYPTQMACSTRDALAVCGSNLGGKIYVWDIMSGKRRQRLTQGGGVQKVQTVELWEPRAGDHKFKRVILASGSSDGNTGASICLWVLSDRQSRAPIILAVLFCCVLGCIGWALRHHVLRQVLEEFYQSMMSDQESTRDDL
ncbi:WD40 repeat-like protein [Pluteus cervinus]|uniref:WD40 repeat-like protein n=1 Tax=Pluteus cervinus TaxID=181527 RepID=A0ACD3A491_9AGAR|nr:WD40 repeat-like protein [Pluteus cervinus]